jgi:hypothetical protein
VTSPANANDTAAIPATAAVCGLFCNACSIFIGSHEDSDRLALFASRMGWSLEQAHCEGCRSQKRTPYCAACGLYACAERRALAFCGECSDYPCKELDDFKRERPHRIEIYDNLARIGEAGVETWLAEAKEHYSCPACGTLNSAYDLKCRSCGHEPGSAYVAAHREAIVEQLRQM